MKLKSIILTLLAVASLTVAGRAFAETHDHTDGKTPIETGSEEKSVITATQQVAFLLSAIHETPPKEAFDRIPGARDIIEKIALNHRSLQQHRAVVALGYYEDNGTLQTWTHLLAEEKTDEGIKHQILLLLGDHFKGEKGLNILKQYINDADPQIRISAAYGLAKRGTDAAFNVLKARRKIEKVDYVIEAIDRVGFILR